MTDDQDTEFHFNIPPELEEHRAILEEIAKWTEHDKELVKLHMKRALLTVIGDDIKTKKQFKAFTSGFVRGFLEGMDHPRPEAWHEFSKRAAAFHDVIKERGLDISMKMRSDN